MTWYEILIIVLAAAFVAGVFGWRIVRKKLGKGGCDCGCSDCSHCTACSAAKKANTPLQELAKAPPMSIVPWAEGQVMVSSPTTVDPVQVKVR